MNAFIQSKDKWNDDHFTHVIYLTLTALVRDSSIKREKYGPLLFSVSPIFFLFNEVRRIEIVVGEGQLGHLSVSVHDAILDDERNGDHFSFTFRRDSRMRDLSIKREQYDALLFSISWIFLIQLSLPRYEIIVGETCRFGPPVHVLLVRSCPRIFFNIADDDIIISKQRQWYAFTSRFVKLQLILTYNLFSHIP